MNAVLDAAYRQAILDNLARKIENLVAAGSGTAEAAHTVLRQALELRIIVFSETALLRAEAVKTEEDNFRRWRQ
jgi:hypothetical protein